MSSTVTIIIAVISMIGSIAAASFSTYTALRIERDKNRATTEALTNKYQDPLALSAYDLQSRLWSIVHDGLLLDLQNKHRRELVRLYTAFVVGQYFSWMYIFRRQAQFLRFSTDTRNRSTNRIMNDITLELGRVYRGEAERAFMLWRGQQMAIGEIMTEAGDDGELRCMGYATFVAKYKNDPTFRDWFQSIDNDITYLEQTLHHQQGAFRVATNRLRRLQHSLVDLVTLLGPDLAMEAQYPLEKLKPAAPACPCVSRKCRESRRAPIV